MSFFLAKEIEPNQVAFVGDGDNFRVEIYLKEVTLILKDEDVMKLVEIKELSYSEIQAIAVQRINKKYCNQ